MPHSRRGLVHNGTLVSILNAVAVIAFTRFVYHQLPAFPGTYVFHGHELEHEDHRMMLQEEVTP